MESHYANSKVLHPWNVNARKIAELEKRIKQLEEKLKDVEGLARSNDHGWDHWQ